jgi:L-amino acid N-acyltransferase YncA
MIGGVDGANGASIAMHRKLGFTEAGHLREVARKFGRWLDLVLMQRML